MGGVGPSLPQCCPWGCMSIRGRQMSDHVVVVGDMGKKQTLGQSKDRNGGLVKNVGKG